MSFEAVFVACYALVIVLSALGLHRLGRRDSSAWTSRALAGHRRQAPAPPETTPADWPHSEVGRLHTLVALIMAAASLTLALVELFRHHNAAELAVLGLTAVVAAAALLDLTAKFTRDRTGRD
ncbi:hypothetical protein [Actinomadura latina]|uniref:Uncharacterized protein n=1 Tax=Actinomadura latina TaxID=163603 RepID=A0A846Z4U1_9ACTN|nr:hypothetical protein [Actinomadura latina]NKZ05685.1 hypothetical protein [Actinomadura latina]